MQSGSLATIKDLISAIPFLVSDASSLITGAALALYERAPVQRDASSGDRRKP
jgi:hypothetical protein